MRRAAPRARKRLGREKIEPQRGSAPQTVTRVDCLVFESSRPSASRTSHSSLLRYPFAFLLPFPSPSRSPRLRSSRALGAGSSYLARGARLPKRITQPKAFAHPERARHPTLPAHARRQHGPPTASVDARRLALVSSLVFLISFLLLFLLARSRSTFGRAHEMVVLALCETTTASPSHPPPRARSELTRLLSSAFRHRSRASGNRSASGELATRRRADAPSAERRA
jgi:hypothetical protein